MATAPQPLTPDTRDWLAVLASGCDECGWRPHDPRESVPRLEDSVARWAAVLTRDDATRRPAETVWSPLEYACHVRDIVAVWHERATAMLVDQNPEFSDFDGDQVAIERRYWTAQPDAVAGDLAANVAKVTAILDGLTAQQWARPGRRGDGASFTVATLSLYFSHELTHHLQDVSG